MDNIDIIKVNLPKPCSNRNRKNVYFNMLMKLDVTTHG